LFLLFLFEGPVFSVIAGGVSASGLLNVWFVLILSVFGNVLGDVILYFVGKGISQVSYKRQANKVKEKSFFKYLENLLLKNFYKALFIIKIMPTFSIIGLLYIGKKRFSFKKFMLGSVVFTTIISSILVFLGYFFVGAISKITYYINVFEAITIFVGLFVILVFVIWFFRKPIKMFICKNILHIKRCD